MSLSKEIMLTINDYSITLSSSIKFYVNDCLDLIFIVNKWGINNAKGVKDSTPFDLTDINAELLIENPELNDTIESTSVIQNKIVFRFTNKYTRITGIGKMQLRLTDNDGCELKLPPFNYEIQATICEELDNPTNNEPIIVTEDGKALLTEDGDTLNLIKISELPVASKIEYTDYMIVNNNNTTKKVLVSEIKCSEEQIKQMEDIPEIKEDLNRLSSEMVSHTHSYEELVDKPSVISGENGATFVPHVSSDGDLSWSNDKELSNPNTVNIKGPQGIKGEKGEQGPQGIQGEKGEPGKDGVTTAISVNDNIYNHVNGIITLPNYPSVPTNMSQLTMLSVNGDNVTMTTDIHQYLSISSNVNITLPGLTDDSIVRELHLYTISTIDSPTVTIMASDGSEIFWQSIPTIGLDSVVEFIFTRVHDSWLAGAVVYKTS